jgi:hypothetical protein
MKKMWSSQQAKIFVENMKKGIGIDAWKILSIPLQEAMVAKACLNVVRSQVSESVCVKHVDDLWDKMLSAAGLNIDSNIGCR